jgi:DNA helicase-2/ATP-dependent DNA helicase PcrA
MSDLLRPLNPEQREAVTLPSVHALVLAGAGSGKTRVLTTRMAWLLQTGQASPRSLLAVTFTNKAAREMLTRLGAILPLDPRGLWIGTFHGLCNRLLRAHYRDAGLPQTFQILDSADQLAAVKRILKAAGVDEQKYPPKQVQSFINANKEQGLRADRVEAWDPHTRKLVELYAAYDVQCQREGVVDFAELLLRCVELLSRNEPVRRHYQQRFSHILVDEFQDTNKLQYRWLTLLCGPEGAIMAVGDDDQSIYAFRGADVGNMRQFEQEYAQGRTIRLEQNYRSHGHILDAANALIARNSGRLGKNLWTDRGEGEPIRVREATGDDAEAQWLVEEVRSLIAEGRARHELAVLYRSNAQSRVIEHALFSAGIPYRVYGGLRFFERQEIKHALAYLRLMENPHDDGAFLRVANFPARGIGARSLEQLTDRARELGLSLHAAVPHLGGAAGSKLAGFVALIDRLRFDTQRLPLPELVDQMLATSGLLAHYKTEKDGEERVENLQELVNAALAHVMEAGIGRDEPGSLSGVDAESGEVRPSPLAGFLSHASLEAGDNQAEQGQDALQLMTVHAAKGLEFDVVFITGLEEGLFPHENSLSTDEGLEEERRLMYVAITRARERLYLSFAQSRSLHGQTRYALRSRFLDELPEACLKWLTPRTGLARAAAPAWGGGWGQESAWDEAIGSATGQGGRNRGFMARREAPRSPAPAGPLGIEVDGQRYRVGAAVVHPRFGEGVIVRLEGSGTEARAQVNFSAVGVKTLALALARLELV